MHVVRASGGTGTPLRPTCYHASATAGVSLPTAPRLLDAQRRLRSCYHRKNSLYFRHFRREDVPHQEWTAGLFKRNEKSVGAENWQARGCVETSAGCQCNVAATCHPRRRNWPCHRACQAQSHGPGAVETIRFGLCRIAMDGVMTLVRDRPARRRRDLILVLSGERDGANGRRCKVATRDAETHHGGRKNGAAYAKQGDRPSGPSKAPQTSGNVRTLQGGP